MGKYNISKIDFSGIEGDFSAAAKNQQFFDALYYAYFKETLSGFHGLPRPAKWLGKGYFFLRIVRLLAPAIALLWAYLFFYFHLGLKFCKTLLTWRPLSSNSIDPKVVFLAICEHSCSTILKSPVERGEAIWLYPQGFGERGKWATSAKITHLGAEQLLGLTDIFFLLAKSVRIHNSLLSENGTAMALQSYAVFDWVLMYVALSKLEPNTILTTEHHDRWAVMADCYCTRSRLLNDRCTVNVVQHGKEHRDTYKYQRAGLAGNGLPYKLRNISRLFLYDIDQYDIFKTHIISSIENSTGSISVCYFSLALDLQELENASLSILFVGHPFCEKFQIALCERIKSTTSVDIYYKPHPAAPPSDVVKMIDWNIILDRHFYPRVSFIISYPSTLVDEYSTCGIRAVTHPLDVEIIEVGDYFERVVVEIGRQLK